VAGWELLGLRSLHFGVGDERLEIARGGHLMSRFDGECQYAARGELTRWIQTLHAVLLDDIFADRLLWRSAVGLV